MSQPNRANTHEVVGGKIATGVNLKNHESTTVDIGREGNIFSVIAYNPACGIFYRHDEAIEGIPLSTYHGTYLMSPSTELYKTIVQEGIPEEIVNRLLEKITPDLEKLTSKMS